MRKGGGSKMVKKPFFFNSKGKKFELGHEKVPNICFLPLINFCLFSDLKELYTSETTLTQKIVLTPLHNEFRLKI